MGRFQSRTNCAIPAVRTPPSVVSSRYIGLPAKIQSQKKASVVGTKITPTMNSRMARTRLMRHPCLDGDPSRGLRSLPDLRFGYCSDHSYYPTGSWKRWTSSGICAQDDNAVNVVENLDIMTELTSTISSIDEVKRCPQRSAWKILSNQLTDTRRRLNSIINSRIRSGAEA